MNSFSPDWSNHRLLQSAPTERPTYPLQSSSITSKRLHDVCAPFVLEQVGAIMWSKASAMRSYAVEIQNTNPLIVQLKMMEASTMLARHFK